MSKKVPGTSKNTGTITELHQDEKINLNDVVRAAAERAGKFVELNNASKEQESPTIERLNVFAHKSLILLAEMSERPNFIKKSTPEEFAQLRVAAEVYSLIGKYQEKNLTTLANEFCEEGVHESVILLQKELSVLFQAQIAYNLQVEEKKIFDQLREILVNTKGSIELAPLRKYGVANPQNITALAALLEHAGMDLGDKRKPLDNLLANALRELKADQLEINFPEALLVLPKEEQSFDAEVRSTVGLMLQGNYVGINTITGAEALFIASIAQNGEEAKEMIARANSDVAIITELGQPIDQLVAQLKEGTVSIELLEDISHVIDSRRLLAAWDEHASVYILSGINSVIYQKGSKFSHETRDSFITLATYIAEEYWDEELEDEDGLKKIFLNLAEINKRGGVDFGLQYKDYSDSVPERQKAIALMFLLQMYDQLTPEEKQKLSSGLYEIIKENGSWSNELTRHVTYAEGVTMYDQIDSAFPITPLLAIRLLIAESVSAGIISQGESTSKYERNDLHQISTGSLFLSWLNTEQGKKFASLYPEQDTSFDSEYEQYVAGLFKEFIRFRTVETIRTFTQAFFTLEQTLTELEAGNPPFPLHDRRPDVAKKDLRKVFELAKSGKPFAEFMDILPVDFEALPPLQAYKLASLAFMLEKKVWERFVTKGLMEKYTKYSAGFSVPNQKHFLEHYAIDAEEIKKFMEEICRGIGFDGSVDLPKELIQKLINTYNVVLDENIFANHLAFILPTQKHMDVMNAVLEIPFVDVTSWSYDAIRSAAQRVLHDDADFEVIAKMVYRRLLIMLTQNEKSGTSKVLMLNPQEAVEFVVGRFMLGEHRAHIPLQQVIFNEVNKTGNLIPGAKFSVTNIRVVIDQTLEYVTASRITAGNEITAEREQICAIENFSAGIRTAAILREEAAKMQQFMPIPDDLQKTIVWEFSRLFPGLSTNSTLQLAQVIMSTTISERLAEALVQRAQSKEVTSKAIGVATRIDSIWENLLSVTQLNIQIKVGLDAAAIETERQVTGKLQPTIERNLMDIASKVGLVWEKLLNAGAIRNNVFIQPAIDFTVGLAEDVELAKQVIEINRDLTKGSLRSKITSGSKREVTEHDREVIELWVNNLQSLPNTVARELVSAQNFDELQKALLGQVAKEVTQTSTIALEKLENHPLLMKVQEVLERFGDDLILTLLATISTGGSEVLPYAENKDKRVIELLIPEATDINNVGELNLDAVMQRLEQLAERVEVSRNVLEEANAAKQVEVTDLMNDSAADETEGATVNKQKKLKAKERRARDKKNSIEFGKRQKKKNFRLQDDD